MELKCKQCGQFKKELKQIIKEVDDIHENRIY